MNVNPASLDPKAVESYLSSSKSMNVQDFVMHIIPDNIVNALSNGDLLQILLFSVLFGLALSKVADKAKPVYSVIKSAEVGFFAVIKIIMRVAPLGALGAMSFSIGKYGVQSLQSLGQLLIAFYITCILFIIFILGGILKLTGFNLFKLLKYLKEELLIVFGTSSSEAALPTLMQKLETLGCSEPVVGLVVPTGYSFNLDGTSIYLTMAAVFLAQATNTPMDISHQIALLLILLLTSKGAAGVTGSGFITLAAVLPLSGGIPVAAITLILGIDWFMSEGRALTNIIGNAVATIVVAKSEKEIDLKKAKELIG